MTASPDAAGSTRGVEADPGPRGQAPRAEDLPPWLRAAAERVTRSLREDPPDLPETDVLAREVLAAAGLVHRAHDDDSSLAGIGPSTLRGRLLGLLRREVLREWPEGRRGEGPGSLLRLMRAFEDAGDALSWERHGLGSPVLDPWARRLLREVAHLLRSPLGSMMFLAEILATGQSGSLNDLQRKQLLILQRAVLTAGTMAGNLLWLAGPADEVPGGGAEPFSLRELLEEVGSVIRPLTEVKGLTLEVRSPDADRRLGAAPALQRLVLNLALAVGELADQGDLRLQAEEEGEDVVFAVVGRGDTLEADLQDLAPLFRPRPDGEGTSLSGPGLAIASASRLLGALGSPLRMMSAEGGVGLTFRLVLPRAANG